MEKNHTVDISGQDDAGDTTVIDMLIVLAKHKRMIIGLPVAVAIIAALISFVLPDVFKARAMILPPQQAQSGAAALLSQLGSVAGAAAGAAGIKNPGEMYVGMLKSRTVADRLIDKFTLVQGYDTSSRDKARQILASNTEIASGKDGLIAVDVFDKDRKRAAQLANAYVEELSRLTTVLAVTEAAQRRLFFERQLEAAKNNLAKAELTLKGALDTRGVISVDTESRAFVETMSRLRAQISAKEIQLQSMRAFVTENNQAFLKVQAELNSLRGELSKFEHGRAPEDDAVQGKQPGLENVQILRDVKYFQMLYELLAKQYEAARLDEAKDNSVIQVLDAAVEPEQKARPARAIIVLLSATLAFFCAVALAFMLDARARALRHPEGAARWRELNAHLRMR